MTDDREMRQVLAARLIELAKRDERIVVLEADLMSCHATKAFKAELPDRLINVGIAEQNMIGVAAGMSAMGKIPFAFSFGPFATRRCYDQVFISVAYAHQNVKIVGTDPGVTAEYNGGTHMPFEDMALMRAVPHMLCFEPTDAAMLEKAVEQIAEHNGAVYMRMPRKKMERVYDESLELQLGKAIRLREGSDITLIASGIMVSRALEACDMLADDGISARVVNIHTWKPIDSEEIIACARQTGAIVTCENHNVVNGLGSAVAEVIVQNAPVPMSLVGVKDEFGQVGKNAYLSEAYHLTAQDIYNAARELVANKH